MKQRIKKFLCILLTLVLMLSISMPVLATDGIDEFVCKDGCKLAGTEHTECVVEPPVDPQPAPHVCKEGCKLAGTEHTECVVEPPVDPQPAPHVCKDGCKLAGTEHTECVVEPPVDPQPAPHVCKEGCKLAGTEHTECVVEPPVDPQPAPHLCKEGCKLAGTEHTECVVEPSAPVCGELDGCADGQHHASCPVHHKGDCLNCKAVAEIQGKISALPNEAAVQEMSMAELTSLNDEVLAISLLIDKVGAGHSVDTSVIAVVANSLNQRIMTLESTPKVAKIGEVEYETLKKAVEAANAATKSVIQLLQDVILGEKLTISSDVTISGEHTITRDDSYTGTFFEVGPGATLTLDGGLTINGGNHWTMDMDAYEADLEAMKQILNADCEKYFSLDAAEPIADAYMITTTDGSVNLKDVTIQNNYSPNSGIVFARGNSTVTLDDAHITHIANTKTSGLVVDADGANVNVIIEDGTVIEGNHVGSNHGLFKIYDGAMLTMNDGEIKNTTGWNSNGTVVGLYFGHMILNGGLICSNSSLWGDSNQRNCAVYPHAGSTFVMTGGTICHNTGKDYAGGIGCYKESATIKITGGNVLDNVSLNNGAKGDDVQVVGDVSVTGGSFTQDIRQWMKEGYHLYYNPETGIYTVTEAEDDSLAKDGYGIIDVEDEDEINFHIIAKKVQVSFDANGGKAPASGAKEVFVGYAYNELPVPTRAGYTFAGWKLGEKVITAESIVETTEAHTLKAQWNANAADPENPVDTKNSVNTSDNVPKTGDEAQVGLYAVMFGISVLGLGTVVLNRKRKSEE